MYSAQAGQKDAAAYPRYNGRGGKAKGSNHWTGNPIWQIRISQDYGITQSESKGTSGESQEGGKDLEDGRTEGTKEATETKKAMAQ